MNSTNPYLIINSDKTKKGNNEGKILFFQIFKENPTEFKMLEDSVRISIQINMSTAIITTLAHFFINSPTKVYPIVRKELAMTNKVYEKTKTYIKENYKSLLIILIAILLLTINLPFYISAPGGVLNTKSKVEITSDFKMKGSLNMAYVSEIKGTVPTLIYALLNPNWDIEKESEVTVGSESIKDEEYRNKLLLEETNDIAVLVAYDHSDITYKTENNKVYVTYIDDLAKTNLEVKDQIIKIDGKEVTEKAEVYSSVNNKKIGDKLKFTVINNGKEKQREATLIDVNGVPKVGALITETVGIKSDYHVDFKFKGTESGSSGGLMMALTIYSYLNKIDLTNGKEIVGTGTIDREGKVGEISGIKYKLMGAVKEKADVFLVPQGKNYQEARDLKNKNGYDLDIVPIETFDEALNYLKG